MDEKPTILFLQETKCNLTFLEKTAAKAWPGGKVTAVEAQGASGGLAILWDAGKIQLQNIHANKHFIQEIFHLLGTNIYGHITNVYFPQESQQKAEILETISHLNLDRSYPLWVAGGDFNMIASLEEKQGGRCHINRHDSLLKDFINNNWLIDIPMSNGLYTWTNKRAWNKHKKAVSIRSILAVSPRIQRIHPDNLEKMQHDGAYKNGKIPNETKNAQRSDKTMEQEHLGNILKEKEILIQEIKQIQQKIIMEGRSEELIHKEQKAEQKLLERDLQEEILWWQKSRIRWLKEGEKNTKFFHKTIVQRHMHNQISQLNNAQGEKIETQAGIEQEFLQYFKAMS
eukprot:PITA_16454